MKKDSTEKILLRYSGAAAAILGVHSLDAQIIKTDIPDTTLSLNGQYLDLNIDLDTSGVVDYRITQFVDNTSLKVTGVQIEARGTAANQVLGLDYGNYNYPFRLNFGENIGKNQPFKGLNPTNRIGSMALMVDTATYPNSQFTGGVVDGYLGVRFQGDLNDSIRTFYGWIRVDVAADLRSITIKEFAYESTPDSAIRAGMDSTNIGLEEVKVEMPELSQRGQYLDISLPEAFTPGGQVMLTDLSGKRIASIPFVERKESISLEGYPKGVLVATLRSNGREVSRKVVVY